MKECMVALSTRDDLVFFRGNKKGKTYIKTLISLFVQGTLKSMTGHERLDA
jgi:hypothetical protein